MAETDVLNPVSQWVAAIDDNPSPDYGFTRGRPDLRVRVKAPGGSPDSREVQNAGHTFKLSWLNRSYACVQMVMRYAAQYEDGYFTIVDWDGAGRHYVGRFTGDINLVQVGNDSYDLRDLTFEEYPGAPMLQYPSDWANDSITLLPRTDGGKLIPYLTGEWHEGTELDNYGMNRGDSLTIDYRGYGFRMWFRTGPDCGQAHLFIDGAFQVELIDFYNPQPGTTTYVSNPYNFGASLGLHRVTIEALAQKNDAATWANIAFQKLQVMR